MSGDLDNPAGVAGPVHEIVAGMMGGASGSLAESNPITDVLWGEAHNVTGSSGDDTYAGTKFGDVVRGVRGDDVLNGRGGNDRITGGLGADKLTGGGKADTFIFTSARGDEGRPDPGVRPVRERSDQALLDRRRQREEGQPVVRLHRHRRLQRRRGRAALQGRRRDDHGWATSTATAPPTFGSRYRVRSRWRTTPSCSEPLPPGSSDRQPLPGLGARAERRNRRASSANAIGRVNLSRAGAFCSYGKTTENLRNSYINRAG